MMLHNMLFVCCPTVSGCLALIRIGKKNPAFPDCCDCNFLWCESHSIIQLHWVTFFNAALQNARKFASLTGIRSYNRLNTNQNA